MVRVPLQLWNQSHWELSGRVESRVFFRHLEQAFPTATSWFVEGTSIAADVREFLESVAERGDYLPRRQTIWPRPVQYRLPFSGSVLAAFADLAEHHAEPELLDHLFVYAGSVPLMEFPDAFARNCPVLIASETDELRLRALAKATGLDLRRVDTA